MGSDHSAEAGRIGRVDVARAASELVVARLAHSTLRGRRNRLLRVAFSATRAASGTIRISLRGHGAVERKLHARRGTNSVTVRLPRDAATYRVVLTLKLRTPGALKQTATDIGRVRVAR